MNLKVEDYYPSGKRFLLRFKEKGGKEKELPVHHKLEELLDKYLKATGLGKEPASLLFPAALGKTGKLSRRGAGAHRRRGHAQATAETSWVARALFASLISGHRHHEFFWKMTALLKPLSESPVMPTVGRPSCTIDEDKRFCSKTWRGFGIRASSAV